jgi:orotate phosphoribosyltransferase-like protein
MKIIKSNYATISYPVGDNIQYNIPIINTMANQIRLLLIKNKVSKDTMINLICSGSSGAIIASIVSTILYENFNKIHIRHIKKDGESSHGNDNYKSHNLSGLNIIVDDFIASGETIKRIFSKINDEYPIYLIAVSNIDHYEFIKFLKEKDVKYLMYKKDKIV